MASFVNSVTSFGTDVVTSGEGHVWVGARLARHERVCLWMHGAGHTAAQSIAAAPTWVDSLRAHGFGVLALDAGSATNYGNDLSATRIDAGLTWAEANCGADTSDGIVSVCFSMGNITLLNWAKQSTSNRARIAAYAGVIPAHSLSYLHDNNILGSEAPIDVAYTNHAGYVAAEPTHNPINYPSYYATVPGQCWYSTNDTVETTADRNAMIAGTGWDFVAFGAVGHAITGLDPDDVSEFLMTAIAE